MRKTIEEHNNEILENFFYSLNDYKMLSLDEASELNKRYRKYGHANIKNHLFRGVQHFIYDFIVLNKDNINLGDQSVVDMEDVISYIRLYVAEGIEYGLFEDASILFANGINSKFRTLEQLSNITSQSFMTDLLNYKLYNMNADKLNSAKVVFNDLFLKDFYSYISTGRSFDEPLQSVKETASYSPLEEQDDPDKLSFDLLHFLDDNDLLVTKDIYEEHFFGDRAVPTGKIRRQDFFLTNQISGGALFEVIRSHPMFKEFRDRYKAL